MIGKLLHRAFRANETAVHELNYLFWECTTRCNLHCRHCGSDCFAASRDVDMPLEDFLRAFDTIPVDGRANPFTVVLTGGEPLLRPDLPEVGRALRSRGVSWGIVSNGWFYDAGMHRRLTAAGLGALTISLDGLEASHDWMRGRAGSYARALAGIAVAAVDPRVHFDVVTCVNKRNINELEELYGRLSALGVRQWRIFTIIPIGRAATDPDMHLSDAEFVRLMDFIKSKRQILRSAQDDRKDKQDDRIDRQDDRIDRQDTPCHPEGSHCHPERSQCHPERSDCHPERSDCHPERSHCHPERSEGSKTRSEGSMKVTFSCEGYLGPYECQVRDVPYFCHAGINIASVLIDGRICACPNIDRDAFSQGSIYEDNFYDVWEHRFEAFRDRRWTRRGPCADCKVWRDCLGNGMHNWHGDCIEVLNCHYGKIVRASR